MPHDPAQPPLEMMLERVGAAVTRHRRRIAAAHGLTPTTMAVLAALGGADPQDLDAPHRAPSHRELAGRLGLSPATLTPVLDALEAAGEVRRERDRTDRRVVRLHRTPAGRARLARAPSARLPRPDPEVDRAVRAWLLAVLAAAETSG